MTRTWFTDYLMLGLAFTAVSVARRRFVETALRALAQGKVTRMSTLTIIMGEILAALVWPALIALIIWHRLRD